MSRYTTEQIERQVTMDMVASEGEMIALRRPQEPQADGAGGFADSDLPPENKAAKRRIVTPVSLRPRNGEDRSWFEDWEGQRYRVLYVLIGPYDDDVMKGDSFVYHGQELTVASVTEDHSYQTRAHVISIGDGNP